jgi:hypothetical protein
MQLVDGHLHCLAGETQSSGELGELDLPVRDDSLEDPVSEADAERLERLIHEDFHAVLRTTNGDGHVPTGGPADVIAHGRFIPCSTDILVL